ncbi:iron uptake system protein EfeO [Aureimonas sp. AU4]|uniref:iron uptake system protein EfeO n=1 Tax=Aureimonas sp. AU4 TaxID=1638163 RepID=UPI00078177F0|nr:iron uptake system protein EfeO [Aureimonas sp. AU4]
MTAPAGTAAPPRGLLLWGVAGAALLMATGAGVFAFASMHAAPNAAGDGAITVTLRDGACEPNAITVPAGRSTFRVVNRTDRVVEWEILDGVMVVEERENIAPGLSQTLSANLREGTFSITCGLLSNPRGQLVVTPSSAPGTASEPALTAFIGPLAEYQVFLAMQGAKIQSGAEALDRAIQAGDLDKARALYAAAREPYLRAEPVAARFADLRDALDPSAAYLAGREADPAFTGYHRIEYGLFHDASLDGLAPVSARLAADAAALSNRLRTARLAPDEMAQGAVRTLRALADTRLVEGSRSYSGGDLAEIDAELTGVRKVATLLRPVAEASAPAALARIDAPQAALDADLASLKTAAGYPAFDTVDAERRARLAREVRTLADALDGLNARLGLSEGGA